MFWQSESRGFVQRHGRDENRHLKMADALTKARHRRRAPDANHSCPRTSIQSPGRRGRTPATARAAAAIKKKACANSSSQTATNGYRPRGRAGEGRAHASPDKQWVTAAVWGATVGGVLAKHMLASFIVPRILSGCSSEPRKPCRGKIGAGACRPCRAAGQARP